MKTFLVASAVLAAVSGPVLAQGAAAPAPSTCYIEVRALMAPNSGIADLGSAIRTLEESLRPQAVAINAIKAQIARLEQREQAPVQATSIEAAFSDDDVASRQSLPPVDNATADQIRRLQAELDVKQAKLKADYTAQQKALVGPVQERISKGAQAYAASKGCAAMKMARSSDLATLASSGARNVTGDFVSWFATGKS